MSTQVTRRRTGGSARLAAAFTLALTAATIGAAPARAIEALDGRFQLHGYFEEQLRGISANFEENVDLTQWYHVLNLEPEFDILPDGWGPLTALSAYARIEVRYDCVWTRACGIFRSADTFGDRAAKLPLRLGGGRYANLTGVSQASAAEPPGSLHRVLYPTRALGSARRVGSPNTVPGLNTLYDVSSSAVRFDGRTYRPAFDTTFTAINDYRFALRSIPGSENGIEIQTLGPWLPKNTIRANGLLRDVPNPFRVGDAVPGATVIATGLPLTGASALPFRPAPVLAAGRGGDPSQARGLNYPSLGAQHVLQQKGKLLDSFDQNFRETELAWNRGASQQDEKELKEAYIDAELFDGRLLARLGKQSIVWGKTELFATTDQFNPNDLALASLPALEESRIALWAARFIFSLYEIGPFEDVRLETALHLDDFEPDDLGRCGEPYTPNPVCDKTAGLFAHGITGYGVIGEDRPENWWNSLKGLQGGARLEFRWDRFSFAIADIYSYTTLPYAHRVFTYERNVDETTGRPREANARGVCITGAEPDCLTESEALSKHSVNQSLFAMICSSSIGFSNLDATACAQNVFNSAELAGGIAPVPTALSLALGGDPIFAPAVYLALTGTTAHQVALSLNVAGARNLDTTLTSEQQALLGCGSFYGTSCTDDGTALPDGIDLLNAEASALLQSFPGFDGSPFSGGLTTDASRPQPGTLGFLGGPACTRWVNGSVVILPGCRGPADPGYVAAQDGTGTFTHPLATGQTFRSEMAAFSWNYLNLLVGFSSPDADGGPVPATDRYYANEIDEFDEFNPMRTDGCSFAAPQFCSNVNAIFTVTGNRRLDERAGGNGRFGRRDFVWAGGGELLLRYEKRNILGFSMDFAEDLTKSNWGIETAWIEGNPYSDADKRGGISKSSTLNLTVSVDRPTFINFLNPNHTFFFNSQVFLQYIPDYRNSFTSTLGPWNLLGTLTAQTGYFQDRLLPSLTLVYDVKSNSAAMLPQIQYRFTENLSATIGAAMFSGRTQYKKMAFEPVSLGNHVSAGSPGAYKSATEQGIAPIRDRDEVYLRLRWTF